MTKKLFIIQIVHGEEEMGSLRDDISEILDHDLGKAGRDEHRDAVKEFWKRLGLFLDEMLNTVDKTTIQIYQDGMPIGGEIAVKIIDDGAEAGIVNYQIIQTLIRNGAQVEQTESPHLLKEEYEIIKEIFSANSTAEREQLSDKYKNRLYEIGTERDQYIGKKIGETLKDDGLGILFIGATHDVVPSLPSEVDYLVNSFDKDLTIEWLKK